MLDACCESEVSTCAPVSNEDDDGDTRDVNDDDLEYLKSSHKVTAVVRKELTPAIRDLMMHGLIQVSGDSSFITFFIALGFALKNAKTILVALDNLDYNSIYLKCKSILYLQNYISLN